MPNKDLSRTTKPETSCKTCWRRYVCWAGFYKAPEDQVCTDFSALPDGDRPSADNDYETLAYALQKAVVKTLGECYRTRREEALAKLNAIPYNDESRRDEFKMLQGEIEGLTYALNVLGADQVHYCRSEM